MITFPLLDAYRILLSEKTELLNIKIKPRTLQTYQTRENTMTLYLRSIKNEQLPVTAVNDDFVRAFEIWIRKKGVSENYFMKNLQQLKEVVSWCVRRKHLECDPLSHYKINFIKKRLVTLSKREVKLIRKYQFVSARLQRAADLFILQCYTGLAYADLMQIDKDKHVRGRWIIIDRQKTCSQALIPIKKKAEKIFDKYSWKIPRISNQKYNSYLKEVAGITGIEKHLTTHVARKTFGQRYRRAGVSLDVIAKMMGHNSVKVTERTYTQIDKKRIKRELKAAA